MLEEIREIAGQEIEIELRNIDQRSEWRARYGLRIPVLELDGEVLCWGRLDAGRLRQALGVG
jgi:hypothetical protein